MHSCLENEWILVNSDKEDSTVKISGVFISTKSYLPQMTKIEKCSLLNWEMETLKLYESSILQKNLIT